MVIVHHKGGDKEMKKGLILLVFLLVICTATVVSTTATYCDHTNQDEIPIQQPTFHSNQDKDLNPHTNQDNFGVIPP